MLSKKAIVMNKTLNENKREFAIEYSFFDNTHETHISMFILFVKVNMPHKKMKTHETLTQTMREFDAYIENYSCHMCRNF